MVLKTPVTPLTASAASQTPYVPTGYEGLQQDIVRKQEIADAMTQAGLSGPGAGARSYSQLAASLAQAWLGKSMNKDVKGLQTSLAAKRIADTLQERNTFQTAENAGGANGSGGDLVTALRRQFGGDPRFKDYMEPYNKAYEARLTNQQNGDRAVMTGPDGKPIDGITDKTGGFRPTTDGYTKPEMVNINGVMVDKNHVTAGTVLPTNATDSVIRGPNDTLMINTPKVTASLASQGFAPTAGALAPRADPNPASNFAPGGPASGASQPVGPPQFPAPAGSDGQLLGELPDRESFGRLLETMRPELRAKAIEQYNLMTNGGGGVPAGSPLSPDNNPVNPRGISGGQSRDQIVAEAQAAIASGANPLMVKARLAKMGIR